MSDETCYVCGSAVEPSADKYSPLRPVYDEDMDRVFHLGCESEVFETVHCSVYD